MFRILTVLTAVMLAPAPTIGSAGGTQQSETGWRQPPEEVVKVLHAPQLPSVWTAPTGEHLLLSTLPNRHRCGPHQRESTCCLPIGSFILHSPRWRAPCMFSPE